MLYCISLILAGTVTLSIPLTTDEVEEDLVVLRGSEQMTLLNSNQVSVEKGKIVTAGSDVCKTSCDMYTNQHLKG